MVVVVVVVVVVMVVAAVVAGAARNAGMSTPVREVPLRLSCWMKSRNIVDATAAAAATAVAIAAGPQGLVVGVLACANCGCRSGSRSTESVTGRCLPRGYCREITRRH